ncbi:MAG: family 1 glycosylhydrolase [Opitutus sp.]|nr:family 1 glycosylhydrolase [Opitutus sp.]
MLDLRLTAFASFAARGDFFWCTGIEDTFITAPHAKTGRTLDEYELTGHYARWREDIDLIANLGVQAARYGIPWHRINPAPGVWNWESADGPLERMLDRGVAPIVDLVHYGLPAWIEGAFLHPDYPKFVAEYAARVAERFKGHIHAYTPLNEPRITAWYCGRLGWWPPFERSWRGFIRVMLGVCRGIVETTRALQSVDPEILPVHVDATDLYTAAEPALEAEAQHRQELVFFALDLISGRIAEGHSLLDWLRRHGVTDRELAWFREHRVSLPFIGLNLYPMFTDKRVQRTRQGRTRIVMTYGEGDIVSKLSRRYWERYRAPLFVSETAATGSVARRQAWLDASVAATRRTRADGIPLLGYTWWPLFTLVTWAYRQGQHPAEYYYKHMGLWDLDHSSARQPTALVELYRNLAVGGSNTAGPLSV